MTREERTILIENIILKEWHMFGQVHNEGGRASCQDDWPTFHIMRASQLSAWHESVLQSYHQDLETAIADGRNLLEEKYARMMASTAPEAYAALKDRLPPLDNDKIQLVNELVATQLTALEAMRQRYPHVLSTMRRLHTAQDTPYETSWQTYQRGELLTYSMQTLHCYAEQLYADPNSYGIQILTETAHSYGFATLDELQETLSRQ